jgi:uncharacterized repeat protein (TIGR03803 family)
MLYTFCQTDATCSDGASPSPLIIDGSGNLYGTVAGGGAQGDGAVFQLKRSGTIWRETVLYSFCADTNCSDGKLPRGSLKMDSAGNLYGVTALGGAHGLGMVFELKPNPTRTAWREKVLYSFCADSNCSDGASPNGPLVLDRSGNLYGTTQDGGTVNNSGVVFKLTLNAARTAFRETVLYAFCPFSLCVDGALPKWGLTIDASGALYGTTNFGGKFLDGVAFAVAGTVERVLYNFCSRTNCPDGSLPVSGVTIDNIGNLYGTTSSGGGSNNGVVFELTKTGAEKVLYSFCAKSGCVDGGMHGSLPDAGITDQLGNLYGTTQFGGSAANSAGVIFELVHSATGFSEKVLYTFCPLSGCPDGAAPSGVVKDTAGNLYGTTFRGGGGFISGGVAFELENIR